MAPLVALYPAVPTLALGAPARVVHGDSGSQGLGVDGREWVHALAPLPITLPNPGGIQLASCGRTSRNTAAGRMRGRRTGYTEWANQHPSTSISHPPHPPPPQSRGGGWEAGKLGLPANLIPGVWGDGAAGIASSAFEPCPPPLTDGGIDYPRHLRTRSVEGCFGPTRPPSHPTPSNSPYSAGADRVKRRGG